MYTATPEQIQEWKAKYGSVFAATVDDNNGEKKRCYLKPPSRKALGYASVAGKNNSIKFNEVILNDCWIAGDEEIKNEDGMFLAVSPHLATVINVKEAELEKL